MWPLEARTIPADDLGKGPLPGRFLFSLSVCAALLFASPLLFDASTSLPYTALFALISCLLGRLFAFDLRYLVLPDLYTWPLVLLGAFALHSYYGQTQLQSVLGILVGFLFPCFLMLLLRGRDATLGGGDVKLMMAAGATFGPVTFFFYVALACFVSLPLMSLTRRAPIPFGPGLVISFVLFLYFHTRLLTFLSQLVS